MVWLLNNVGYKKIGDFGGDVEVFGWLVDERWYC